MGAVSNRGTKDRPLWSCRYVDADGKRKQRPTKRRQSVVDSPGPIE